VSSDGFGVGAGVFVGVCTFLALLSDQSYVHFTSLMQLQFVGVEQFVCVGSSWNLCAGVIFIAHA
jgi:hypothetical protein